MEVQGSLLRTGKPPAWGHFSSGLLRPQLGAAALHCIGLYTGMKNNEVRPAAHGTWYRGAFRRCALVAPPPTG